MSEDREDFLVFPPTPVLGPARGSELAHLDRTSPPDLVLPGDNPIAARRGAATRTQPVRSVLYLGLRADTVDPLRHVFPPAAWRARRANIDDSVRSDVVASFADLEAVPDAAFDAVWACRVLQYFDEPRVTRALGHVLRILKPGGFVVALVPDLQAVAELIVADRLDETVTLPTGRSVTAIDLVYGPHAPLAPSRGTLAYRTGFTASRVAAALVGAGFQRVRTRRQGLDLWAIGHRPSSASEAPPVDAPSP